MTTVLNSYCQVECNVGERLLVAKSIGWNQSIWEVKRIEENKHSDE